MGLRTAPWGTPESSGKGGPMREGRVMDAVLFVRKLISIFVNVGCSCRRKILYMSPACQTLSKALATSRRTMFVRVLRELCCAIVS